MIHKIKILVNKKKLKVKKALKTRSKLLEIKNPEDESKLTSTMMNPDIIETVAYPSDTAAAKSSSRFSFFFDFNKIMPKEILGVDVSEIKKDIRDGGSQISSL